MAALNSCDGRLANFRDALLARVGNAVTHWKVYPFGSEGYRTAEVALGGVNTDDIFSKTMQAKSVPGLFLIGEVVDFTGHLGGYIFNGHVRPAILPVITFSCLTKRNWLFL